MQAFVRGVRTVRLVLPRAHLRGGKSQSPNAAAVVEAGYIELLSGGTKESRSYQGVSERVRVRHLRIQRKLSRPPQYSFACLNAEGNRVGDGTVGKVDNADRDGARRSKVGRGYLGL